jgi:transcription initiation factor TFIID TATA-box-binding protein
VAEFNLCVFLDLVHIAHNFEHDVEYDPNVFRAVVVRLQDPKATFVIYRKGKVFVRGARNEDAARSAAEFCANHIKSLGYDVRFKDFKVYNFCGKFRVPFSVDLATFHMECRVVTSYDPDMFPALKYWGYSGNQKCAALVWYSGKVSVAGARSPQELKLACDELYLVLCRYRKEVIASVAEGQKSLMEGGELDDVVADGRKWGCARHAGGEDEHRLMTKHGLLVTFLKVEEHKEIQRGWKALRREKVRMRGLLLFAKSHFLVLES